MIRLVKELKLFINLTMTLKIKIIKVFKVALYKVKNIKKI